jgi:hypothetical protein
MDNFLTIEWNDRCGISGSQMMDFLNSISHRISFEDYGQSVSKFRIIVICRIGEFKQRKRLNKSTKILDFDIILDYDAVTEANAEKKIEIISQEIIGVCERVFCSYKFEDLNTSKFLKNWENAVEESLKLIVPKPGDVTAAVD